MKGLTVLSLFNGISCGMIALEKAGISVNKYYSSEIKKVAIQCTHDNYPDIIEVGDVTEISYSNGILSTEKGYFTVGKIDLVIGGSPCQDFSCMYNAGQGLKGEKSKLFYHYHRILNEVKPKYFFLENVKMKKDQELILNEYMGCKPIKVNSSLVSAQTRNRLYWTNIPFSLPEDKHICLQDILTDGYTYKKKASCLLVSDGRPCGTPIKMFHRSYGKGFMNLIFKSKEHFENCKNHYDTNFKNYSAKQIDEKLKNEDIDLSVYEGIRWLNKTELQRCQTIPENYCENLTRNKTADVCGDGWTVDTIVCFFKNIK